VHSGVEDRVTPNKQDISSLVGKVDIRKLETFAIPARSDETSATSKLRRPKRAKIGTPMRGQI
jgi:hypothetical protein